jgi:hypothetical protein
MTEHEPIEVIPYGRTEEEQAKLDRIKERGQRGLKLFFLEIIAMGLLIILCAIYSPFTSGP